MEFLKEVIFAIAGGSGFAALDWKTVVMLVIACILLYMGIGKGFEPLLLVPIAFGMLLANLPITGLFAEPVYDAATHSGTVGFMWVLYQGVQYAIYPSIIFMGIGAMTDFGPLLANPMSLLLGAAAQLGNVSIRFRGCRAATARGARLSSSWLLHRWFRKRAG